MNTEVIKNKDSLSDASILILDDDPSVLKLVTKTLLLSGFRNVKAVRSKQELYSLIGLPSKTEQTQSEALGADILISDIVLDDGDGFEICKSLKEEFPEMSVILMSAYEISDVSSKLVEAKADDFLIKPFKMTELQTRIKLLLAKKKAGAQTNHIIITKAASRTKNNGLPYIGDAIDNYVIVDFIAWGNSSVLYKVASIDGNNIFALKLMTSNPNSTDNENSEKRFENEINIISELRHPNIISFIDRGRFNGMPYLVMEFVDGVDMEVYLLSRGKPEEPVLWCIARDLASALNELDARQIVHRDIKLKNILYSFTHNSIKLIDFGIALVPESLSYTRKGFVLGTPLYMAPEIAEGGVPSHKSDIYSYGATIYHLACGSPPYTAKDSMSLFQKMKVSDPIPIHRTRNDLETWWDYLIVEQCLSKNPDNRPDTYAEIIDFLDAHKPESVVKEA